MDAEKIRKLKTWLKFAKASHFLPDEEDRWARADLLALLDAPPADSTFIAHIQSHLGIGQVVVCKICGKSAYQIIGEAHYGK
ncbi:MAG: hypothetical protein IMZ62_15950 [Chloroflexi bacterium]|nr:hypothetical protein [Chloroflexota bacterium]